MCGIVGRVNASREKHVRRDEVRLATRALVHRGPDGDGVFCSGPVGLGHTRLAIVDIAGGAQPMSDPSGNVQVVFNGEIYNHEELRAELRSRGFEFVTRTDTEVLVHGYEAWGDGLTGRLRGMFAFALWDARRHRLLAARDRVGIKPLYWTRAGEDLVFASEIKALLCFDDVARLPESSLFPEYLALRYVPGPDTLFRGIFRLQPGHQLAFEDGRLRIRQYWDIPLASSGARAHDVREEAERFRTLLLETVRQHLMGEVPVGVFLSGGLDSTSIAWAIQEVRKGPLKSFAVGFDDDADGELAFARLAAASLGTEHRELRLTAQAFHSELERLVWHLDEPNSDGACIPLMALARRAREEVTVVLSGEGADEVLAGYGIYLKQLVMEQARRLGGGALQWVGSIASNHLRDAKARKYLHMLQRPIEARYFGVGRAFEDELLVQTFGEEALGRLVQRFAPLWERTRGQPILHRVLYNDTKVWLPDDLLIKADKTTMSTAIELRVPFLDHVLLEHAWRLPVDLKLRGSTGKFLLRRAVAGRIPDSILHRPKKGFPVPIGRWLRTTLHDACRDQLLARNGPAHDLFGARVLTRLLEEHRTGRVDRTEELYSLWVLDGWYRRFIAAPAEPRARSVVRAPPELFDGPAAEHGQRTSRQESDVPEVGQ